MRRALVVVLVAGCSTSEAAPSRTIDAMPAPTAAAAHEDLPAGASCRIGSERLPSSRDYGDVVFPAGPKLYAEGLGHWLELDAKSGKQLAEFELAGVTAGVSASGICVAAASPEGDGRVDLFDFASRKTVAHHQFPEDKDDDVIPADDCRTVMQRRGYDRACVSLFGAGFTPQGDLCVGKELSASALSGNGKRVALSAGQMSEDVYAGDGVHVFDTKTRTEIAMIKRTGEYLGTVSLSNDGELVAFADGATVRIVRVSTKALVSTFALPAKFVAKQLVFSPTGKRLAISMQDEETQIAVIDVASGQALFTQRNLPDFGRMAFHPDGNQLAYAAGSGLRVVNAQTGEDLVAPGRLFHVKSASLSPDGERAVVSSMGHVSVWNARDCSLVADVRRDKPVEDLLVAPGGKVAIGYDRDGLVRIDLATGKQSTMALEQYNARDSEAISPDGTLALAGIEVSGGAKQVLVVDIASMKLLRRIVLPKVGPIGALIASPRDKHFYAVAPGGFANGDSPIGNTTAFELDPVTGKILKTIEISDSAQRYDGAVVDGGKSIIVNDRAFDRRSGKELPQEKLRLAGVSTDGATVAWSDAKGTFAWSADQPVAAGKTGPMQMWGRLSVGAGTLLSCGEQSCLIVR